MVTCDTSDPMQVPEQEWLQLGQYVNHAAGCRDSSPARIDVSDPRYFALHKVRMVDQTKRSSLKPPRKERAGANGYFSIVMGTVGRDVSPANGGGLFFIGLVLPGKFVSRDGMARHQRGLYRGSGLSVSFLLNPSAPPTWRP